MKLLAEPLGLKHRLAWMVGAIALASCALLGIAARAHASETIYWDNYNDNSVAFANLDGSDGGELDTSATAINEPEGMAFDPVNDRIYIASSATSTIDWVSIEPGGGSGFLDAGAAPVEDPKGIAVDPATQIVYWVNEHGGGSIGYASADETGVGGELNTAGATPGETHKLALDTTDGRVYWVASSGSEERLAYANLDGTGGGDLNVPAEELPEKWAALNIDPASQRLYILAREEVEVEPSVSEEENFVYWVSLSGVGGGEVDTTNASFHDAFGMAFDPSLGRFYWANYQYDPTVPAELPFGTATLAAGGGSGFAVAGATLDGPQDPLVLKNPTGVSAPVLTVSGTTLSCSQGTWSENYPGSYVYGAPESYSYQWSKDGQAIAGATGTTMGTTGPGTYTCAVTATNQFGSGSQTSGGYTISPPVSNVTNPTPTPPPASFGLASTSKKKVKVQAGRVAVLKLDLENVGGTPSSASKVCAKLTKKAKKGLVVPKCVAVAALAPGATKVVTLRVKTKGGAKGTYKFSVVVSGASGSTTLAERITVTAKKKHHRKHGKK